jgi:hypothetical protein
MVGTRLRTSRAQRGSLSAALILGVATLAMAVAPPPAQAAQCSGLMNLDGTFSLSCDTELGSNAGSPGTYRLFVLYAPYMTVSSASVSAPPGVTCGADGTTQLCTAGASVPAGTTVLGSAFRAGTPFCDTPSDGGPIILAYWPGATIHARAGVMGCSASRHPDVGDDDGGSDFRLGKAKLRKKAGTARLAVEVPGPGTLTLGGDGVASLTRTIDGPGTVNLPVRAKGKAKRRLNSAGKVRVKAEVSFRPKTLPGRHIDLTKSITLKKG